MKYTDPRLYIQGIGIATMVDPATGDILYWDDKFQEGNITSSADNGAVTGGLGNATAVLIPHTSQVHVTSAAYSNYVRAASVGSSITSGAPVMTCQTVVASGTSISVGTTAGTPVADVGMSAAYCYVQEVGAASPIEKDGTAYPIAADGTISDFVATDGKTYFVTYYTNHANAKLTTVTSNMKGKVVRFVLQRPIYTNVNPNTKAGDLWGMHYDIIPALQLLPDGGSMSGTQTSATTTAITGMAVIYDSDVVAADCENCTLSGNPMWYQLDVPCDQTSGIEGLVLVGGLVEVPQGGSVQTKFKLAVNGNNLVDVDQALMNYEMTTTITGVSVGTTGIVTATDTATGDGELTATYTNGSQVFTLPVNVTVTTT